MRESAVQSLGKIAKPWFKSHANQVGSYKWVKCLLFFVYMVISNSIISHTVTQL